MTGAWWITLTVSLWATLCFFGVALWGWLTPNGPAWNAFRLKSSALSLMFALWLYRVVTVPAAYQTIDVRQWLVYGAAVAASVFAMALALALKRGVVKRGKKKK